MSIMTDPLVLSRVNAQQGYVRARALNIKMARVDPEMFNLMILRDEETGKPVKPAPVHTQWHEILNTHDRVVFWSHVDAGKTNQVSVGRVLYELGRNPNLRIVVLSKTQDLAKKIVRLVSQYIDRSEDLHTIFPNLKPSKRREEPWTSDSITVDRPNLSKDPSLQAIGLHGAVIGARIDLLIVDDVLDSDNTNTVHLRDDVWNWLQRSVMNRLAKVNPRVWIMGNAWHPQDAMHRFAELPRYKSYKFPVLDPATGESTWPDRWPLSRVEQWRQDLHPAEFARALLCMSRDDSASVIKQEWIDVALEAGNGFSLVRSIDTAEAPLPPGYFVVSGVDLASRKTESADKTAILTALVWPDGHLQVINVRTGKLSGPEIVDAISDVHDRYGGVIIVENNAAQEYILQFARSTTRAAVVPFTTGKNKVDPQFGVAALGADLKNGTWIIPNRDRKADPVVDEWLTQMLFFNPKDHVGDLMMAAWFVREYARKIRRGRRLGAEAGDEPEQGSVAIRSIG